MPKVGIRDLMFVVAGMASLLIIAQSFYVTGDWLLPEPGHEQATIHVDPIRFGSGLLLAVAVAIAFGADLMRQRAEFFWRKARWHASNLCRNSANPDPEAKEWERRCKQYHEAMKQKYERAARYPWLLVPPDPPMPKWLAD